MKILYPFKDTHKSCIDLTGEDVRFLIVFSVPLVLFSEKQSLLVATEYMFWLAPIQALLFSLMLAGLDISPHFQKQGLKT